MRPQKTKRGRGVSPYLSVLGTLIWKLSCALAALLAKRKQDITRTDNIYTQIKQPLARIPSLQVGIKSCLPFIVMSVGYAELLKYRFIVRSVSFKRLLPPPSETRRLFAVMMQI